ALLIDVGGGSTELTLIDKGEGAFSISLPLGTVRVLETFLARSGESDPAKKGTGGALDRRRAKLMSEQIDRSLAEARPHLARANVELLGGTGGTLETLADLCPVEGAYAGRARPLNETAAAALCTSRP